MSQLSLSSTQSRAVSDAMTTLANPFGYASADAWRLDCIRHVRAALDADRVLHLLASEADPLAGEAEDREGIHAYMAYYGQRDTGLRDVRREKQLAVVHMYDVYDQHAYRRTEVFNDFCKRYKLLDALAVAEELPGSPYPASILVYHDTDDTRPFGEHGRALLGLLRPAFRAGIHGLQAVRGAAQTLGAAIAVMKCPAVVVSRHGGTALANDAMRRVWNAVPAAELVLRETAHRMWQAMEGQVRAVSESPHRRGSELAPSAYARRVRFGAWEAEARATWLPPQVFAEDQHLLITFEGAQRLPTTWKGVPALSARESAVAAAVARGATTEEVAAELGLATATVRRHVEHCLAKVGVTSRVALAAWWVAHHGG